MKAVKIQILFVLGVVFALNAYAQKDTSLTMDVTFEGGRRLFLRDANKLSIWPETRDNVIPLTSITYTTIPMPKNTTVEPKLIPSARIKVDEKLERLYRGYIKAGYGTYFTPMVDMYYTDGRSKKGTFGIHYKHFSSAGGVTPNDKDSVPDHFSDNKAELWAKWFFKKTQLLGSVQWDRNLTNWYGLRYGKEYNGPSLDSIRFKQRLNTFGGKASFLTYQRDTGEFNFRADLALRGTQDFYQGKEVNFDVLFHGRMLMDDNLYSTDIGVNINSFKFFGPDMGRYGNVLDAYFLDRTSNNAVIKIVPQIQTVWRDLRVKVGAGLYIEGRSDTPGHFYPLAELSYSLLNGIIVPYAGIRGSTEPTTYLGLYQLNPFVQHFPDLKNKNNKLDAYAGIGGAVSRTVSYNAGINYYEWSNFAYFINDTISDARTGYYSWGNAFSIIYDDLNAINVHGELAVYAGEKWKANVRADYFKYTLGNQVHAWHQPNFKIMGTAQYNLKNKFIIGGDLFYVGARWARSYAPVPGVEVQGAPGDKSYQYKLKGFLDANFKVEYRYNKRVSAWVQLHNAFAIKYQRWSGYNNQRLLAMLGATYAF
jgi:hypothetical protein